MIIRHGGITYLTITYDPLECDYLYKNPLCTVRGSELKKVRKKLGIMQKTLAEIFDKEDCDFSWEPSYISKYEHKKDIRLPIDRVHAMIRAVARAYMKKVSNND